MTHNYESSKLWENLFLSPKPPDYGIFIATSKSVYYVKYRYKYIDKGMRCHFWDSIKPFWQTWRADLVSLGDASYYVVYFQLLGLQGKQPGKVE